jgi:centromere protein C
LSHADDDLDIAYAPSGIETREVKDSTFRFAKLLSSSFIGSGVVELPPEGVKKPKNSKKMHMVFYVCHGRVQVDISGVQFSAGKGCVFQVPRGKSELNECQCQLWQFGD